MNEPIYITTTLPYVNADPHIGFALEIVHADIIARFYSAQGRDVFFNTGTDEHGQKIYEKALQASEEPQEYVDKYAKKFQSLKQYLGLMDNLHFIRTTDMHHIEAAQEFWKRCDKAGDIYKKLYKIKYCVGCEMQKTDSELQHGKCPIHPSYEMESREEENYFFRFSKYQKPLLELYHKYSDFVIPDYRFNEIKSFVERGLEDFSISRLRSKMPWGVAVPGDEQHVMYVWFDALINYISTLGWPKDEKQFEKYWGTLGAPRALQFAGKDNIRQQSAMWQAMLMSAGLPTTRKIIIHGFITSEGQKMSKSLGNVIDPLLLVKEYGTDALRYYLARETHTFEDSDFTLDKFKLAYNAHLANGLGNLTSRIMKMAEKNLDIGYKTEDIKMQKEFTDAMEHFEIQRASDIVWERISKMDKSIQQNEPYKMIKTDPAKAKRIMRDLTIELFHIAHMLAPILPDTSQKIIKAVERNIMPEPLFVRK